MKKTLIATALLVGMGSVHADDSFNYFAGKPQPFKQTSGKVVMSYYYGDKTADELPGSNLTHLVYAFLRLCGPGEYSGDKAICDSNRNSKGAEGSDFRLAVNDSTPDVAAYEKIREIKERYPHLKITYALGGWGGSNSFYYLAGDPAKRAVFISSLIEYLQQHPDIDGYDIDWEHPTDNMGQDGVQLGSSADAENYVVLMQELRAALNAMGQETGRQYLLTTAVPTGGINWRNLPYDRVAPSVDYILLMTYGLYGGWTNDVGHHTALQCTSYSEFCVDGTVQEYLSQVPANKLVIGTAMFSQGWQNVSDQTDPANPMTGTGDASGLGWGGAQSYSELYESHIGNKGVGINGYAVRYDPALQAHYLWNDAQKTYIGYDDPRDVERKGKYVVSNNLAGIFAWQLGQDNGDILNAMNLGVGNQRDRLLPECPSQQWNKKQIYQGGSRVTFKKQIMQAKWWNVGERPAKQSWNVWSNLGDCY
ncbi:glycosyl hydrolase family 18 protein [Chitinolyticbacter meiyuanensis]|uniref:glycosyl hydrolase family 18 protein n=1 Tax=Chitinolyticbacter meiyuanensis TaxID=682798 RepID=UPI0016525DDE|nr:glycosyl hydrolase family 18 protein [Chitinolyticbacter meiyuanensis]